MKNKIPEINSNLTESGKTVVFPYEAGKVGMSRQFWQKIYDWSKKAISLHFNLNLPAFKGKNTGIWTIVHCIFVENNSKRLFVDLEIFTFCCCHLRMLLNEGEEKCSVKHSIQHQLSEQTFTYSHVHVYGQAKKRLSNWVAWWLVCHNALHSQAVDQWGK